MDKIEILQALEDVYGTSDPSEVSHYERWQLYETLKSNIRLSDNSPTEYTQYLILICDTLEL